MSYSVVGRSFPRNDAVLQVTGQSLFGDDFVRPNMLYGRALRSKHAHAKILKLDTSQAEKLPGVKAVITSADIVHNRFGVSHEDQPVLADDKVRYYGDAVAVVAATSWEAAEDAIELIKVDYEPLPAVFDPIEAMKADAPKVHGDTNIATHLKIRFGDIAQGWKESDAIYEEQFVTPIVEHVHLEPHAAWAEAVAGEVFVTSSTQKPFACAADLSKVLGIPMHRIRVATSAVGGAFGGKYEITIEPYVALLAMKTGRPVKMVFTREDEFEASTVRHPYAMKYKSGLKKDGTLVARQIEIVSDSGAYVSLGQATLTKASILAAGPYRIPYVNIDGKLVYTNNPVGGAMRGFGVIQLGFACEVHMDTIASEMGIDPVELRLKNIFVDNSTLATGQVLEAVSLKECMKEAIELAGWKKEIKFP